LSHREGHDTTQIVVLRATLLLAEIPHESRAKFVHERDDVEQERLDVVEERFVIQEHLGEEAEVLAIDLTLGRAN